MSELELIERANELVRRAIELEAEIRRRLWRVYAIADLRVGGDVARRLIESGFYVFYDGRAICFNRFCAGQATLFKLLRSVLVLYKYREYIMMDMERLHKLAPEVAEAVGEGIERLDLFVELLRNMGYGMRDIARVVRSNRVEIPECLPAGSC